MQLTYDQLNELTHQVADKIDEAIHMDTDRCQVNDLLSGFLQDLGVTFVEEDE